VPFWRRGRDRDADAGPAADSGAGTAGSPDESIPPPSVSLEVERAMQRVVEEDTRENRRGLFELLLASTLLAATADPPPPGIEPDFATVAGENGPVLPVFTRPDALLAWRRAGTRRWP
jgi:SseB protein N-terminal domain